MTVKVQVNVKVFIPHSEFRIRANEWDAEERG